MKYILLALFLALPLVARSEYSMRKCLLLPITDSVGGAIAYKVHEELEDYLKNSSWCFYKSNSALISIFGKYRNNLQEYLQNPDVIRVAAEKMKAGSIMRINLISHISGIEIRMDIFAENGEDIYFSEKLLLQKDDITLIVQSLKNWLTLYEKNIPYDGKVLGVLGDQITIDIGKNYRVNIGDEIVVRRALNKKRHPLLKRIVEWDTILLAKGKVFNVSDNQALGVIKTYTSKQKLIVGDWVTVEQVKETDITQKYEYSEVKGNEFGKLGLMNISLELSKSDVSTVLASNNKSVGAMILGVNVESEIWITREYLALFEFGRRFGQLSRKTGNLQQDSVSTTEGVFKLLGGYKYLPLGFFYGPQINFYAGYGSYTFNLDTIAVDGFGEAKMSGILTGIRASLPVQRELRAFVEAEIMPFPKYEETTAIFGGANSESSLQIEIGAQYQYNPLLLLTGSMQLTSNKASFSGGNEIHYRSTAFRFGGAFSF